MGLEEFGGGVGQSPLTSPILPQNPDIFQQNPQINKPVTPQSVQIRISKEMERVLVMTVLDDYDNSKQAREQRNYGTSSKGDKLNFDKWLKELRDLYNGERDAKEIPWKFCSNRSLRIAAAIIDMLHSRLFPAVINSETLKWRPANVAAVPKVERISKLMYWWMWVHCKMRSFFDNWVLMTLGYGDQVTETFWKVEYQDTGETVSEPILGPDGMQLPNQDGSMASMSYRNLKTDEFTASKIYLKEQVFLEKNSCDIQNETVIFEEEVPYRLLEQMELEGKYINVSTELKDKIPAPDMAVGLPPEEVERIKNLKIRNYPVKLLHAYIKFDADGDQFPEDVRVTVSPEYQIFLGGIATTNVTKSGKRAIDFTKIASRIENPEENWGYGVLERIKEMAQEVDAIFNQMTDANTLSIMRPIFYDPSGNIDAQAIKLAPNKMIPVPDPQRNVNVPDMTVNIQQLIMAIRLVLEFIERLTAASSYVMGKESEIVGGSGTATRTNAIMSSADVRFALPAERLREGAARIINQHLDLLQKNIPKGLETRILGDNNLPIFGQNELSEEGISGQFSGYLLPDPAMAASDAERQLIDTLYSVLLQNPLVISDPNKIYRITADMVKSRGKEPARYLGPEPDTDMIDDPKEENSLILQGDFSRVRAQMTENHIYHIKAHQDLLESPDLAGLPSNLLQEVMRYTQSHIQEHQQQMQAMMSLAIGGKGGGQGIKPGSEGDPNKRMEGTNDQSRMESIQGPLGAALERKRTGEESGSA